jgi:ionotropic glutamate receptor
VRDKNSCQNEGSIIGSGSLTFASFEGPIILTGVVSTSSLLVALIMYFYRNKKIKPHHSDSEQISSHGENER